MPPEVFPRHRSAHFKHIFSGGYSAAYYTYIWAEVLDRHLFSVFEKSGDVWNKKLAEKFRKTFLEKGASEDPMMLFRSFTGANEPDPQPFFEDRGLTPVKRK
jgi:peptidyl-dipeptidase Dcp